MNETKVTNPVNIKSRTRVAPKRMQQTAQKRKGIQFDNAAQRKTYVGYVYEAGTNIIKSKILDEIDDRFSIPHREGDFHIHDLEAYGQTYNCLQVDILQGFPYKRFEEYSTSRKIIEIINHYKDVIAKLGNEQSGGIGFPNFDDEMCVLFNRMDITVNDENLDLLRCSIESFVDWSNRARERCGQTTYYVTLNLGLSTTIVGRFTTKSVIEYYMNSPAEIIKPNIVFKVKKGINHLPNDPNYDLFCLANESTCKKMIPTYLLFDSKVNSEFDPRMVGIMGCRTKVVSSLFGEDRSIGRINVDCATLNLPRIALKISRSSNDLPIDQKIMLFKQLCKKQSDVLCDLLIDRYHRLITMDKGDFPVNCKYNIQLTDFNNASSLEEIFRHGTLSIGFIGLSEAFEILSGEKFYHSKENHLLALDIVGYMRNLLDEYRQTHQLNFTLLASAGEYISGRFPDIDRLEFDHPILEEEYYTNSFHVDVNSGLNPLEKVRIEGPFHELSNGGCITYVEFQSAPLNNIEAIAEVLEESVRSGINYIGFNFPLDSCRTCKEVGTFDDCPKCGGSDIFRIRRVSGYLEELEYFTPGKKAEEFHRTPNART